MERGRSRVPCPASSAGRSRSRPLPAKARRPKPRTIALISLLVGGCPGDDSASDPDGLVPPPAPGSAVDALNETDPRTPVPLQPMMARHQKQNMQAHLVAIQRITEALSRQDWAAVGEAATAIEASPQMQMQCEHMGRGAEGFPEPALDFHRRADAIGVAAAEQDTGAVLHATARTLEACTSCHATCRQDVVEAEVWEVRTGSEHRPMDHGQL